VRTVVHDPLPCPACGSVLSRSRAVFADAGDPHPTMGDLTVCPRCAEILQFGWAGGPYLRPKLKFDRVPEKKRRAFPTTVQRQLASSAGAIRRRIAATPTGGSS
jgi:hypothetical protein